MTEHVNEGRLRQMRNHADAQGRREYGFLRHTPDTSRAGLTPGAKGEPGSISEPWLRMTFGDFDLAVPEGDEDMVTLRSLHALAVGHWRALLDSVERIRLDDDPTLNDDARLKLLGRVVAPKLEKLARIAEEQFDAVRDSIARDEAGIEKASKVVDAVELAAHPEIRASFKAMKPSDHILEVHRLIAEGDALSLQAIATVPPSLSGMKPEQHRKAKEALGALKAPELAARVATLRNGMAKAAHALSALDRHTKSLIDLDRANALAERERTHQ